jgi:signal transduction histidine kinase/DNA-binding response OmpR family regulator
MLWVRSLGEAIAKEGKVIKLSGTFQDITHQKKIEEQRQKLTKKLQQLNLTLEEKVRKRTRQLEEAMSATAAASRAKSEFLASMSHELRTPLNAIIGFSEIMADKSFGEINKRQERYINNILTSGRHLLSLINDILDLSKVEAGKMELELSQVNIEKLLKESLVMVKEKAFKHNIRLNINVQEVLSGIMIEVDERKLKQIIFNLLSNAVKFTPDGGKISISASRVSSIKEPGYTAYNQEGLQSAKDQRLQIRTGSFIEISVIDTGIGIAPENQQRVFNEFEQIDSSYARRQPGTGLGLALTKKLVELHGGSIALHSKGENKGSTFTIWLPEKNRKEDENSTIDSAALLEPNNSGKLPALVVEDDPRSAELLCELLAEAGFNGTVALNGEKALRILKTLKPCLILLDILLPKMSGWEVLEAVKSQPETRHIPVIVVSITEDSKLGFTRGVLEWFVKPVERDILVNAMQKAKTVGGAPCRVVLVIDDDTNIVELTTAILRNEGYTVLTAFGGHEGIDKAIEHIPDVIILDLMMPDLTGFEVIEALQKQDETKNIPILIYTSKDLSPAEQELLHRSALAVIAKTDNSDSLSKMIRQAARVGPEE